MKSINEIAAGCYALVYCSFMSHFFQVDPNNISQSRIYKKSCKRRIFDISSNILNCTEYPKWHKAVNFISFKKCSKWTESLSYRKNFVGSIYRRHWFFVGNNFRCLMKNLSLFTNKVFTNMAWHVALSSFLIFLNNKQQVVINFKKLDEKCSKLNTHVLSHWKIFKNV